MKITYMILFLPFVNSFPFYKHLRVNYRLIKKQSSKELSYRKRLIIKNQNKIVDNSISVLNDSAVNEMVQFLKFYHLTNDEYSSIIYIIFYEIIWFSLRLNKIYNENHEINLSNEETQVIMQQLIINICIYVTIKNIIFNNIIYIINNSH